MKRFLYMCTSKGILLSYEERRIDLLVNNFNFIYRRWYCIQHLNENDKVAFTISANVSGTKTSKGIFDVYHLLGLTSKAHLLVFVSKNGYIQCSCISIDA